MKIAYFANYSPVSLSSIVYQTLLRMGHEVHFFSPNVAQAGEGGIKHCQALVNVAEILKENSLCPDLLLFVESSIAPLLFPIGLEQLNIPSAWWAIDNHMNYRWHKDFARLFDFSFFAQKNFIQRASDYSGKQIGWLPLACNPSVHKDYVMARIFDCSFVGNLNPRREKFFKQLSTEAPVNVCSGKNQLEMAQIYAQSRTAFNLAIREDVNMRVFETMASGACLITQRIENGLLDLFTPGEHLLTHQVTNAAEAINKALANPEKTAEIALKGFKEVQENHTYEKRLQHIIDLAMGHQAEQTSLYQINFSKSRVLLHRHFKEKKEAHTLEKALKKQSRFRFYLHQTSNLIENLWFKLNLMGIEKY